MNEKCYSLDGELFHSDWCSMTNYGDEPLEVGQKYFLGDAIHETHEGIITLRQIEYFLENLDDGLSWEHGDYFYDRYTDTTKEQREELRNLVLAWAEKHVKLGLYKVRNVEERIITKEDLE